jgi:hypothetical protein
MELFLKKNGEINLTSLSKSKYCTVQNLSQVRRDFPEKFDTLYLGIICQENGIDTDKLKMLMEIEEVFCKKNTQL